jgi:hypothetical protein
METAGPRGEISFWRFLRYGSVITIVNVVLAFGDRARMSRRLATFFTAGATMETRHGPNRRDRERPAGWLRPYGR